MTQRIVNIHLGSLDSSTLVFASIMILDINLNLALALFDSESLLLLLPHFLLVASGLQHNNKSLNKKKCSV